MTILRVIRNSITRGNTVLLRILSDAISVGDSATATYVPVGGGSLADGATVVVTGPSATLPSSEWLGGKDGVIESGTPDTLFSRSGWSDGFPNNISDWYYSTARTLNRSRALLFDSTIVADGRGTKSFDYGSSGITQEYRSCNYFWEVPAEQGDMQWKIWRGGVDLDMTDHIDPSWRWTTMRSGITNSLTVYDQDTGGSEGSGLHYFPDGSVEPDGIWIRCECWVTVNSPLGTANGTFRARVTRVSDNEEITDTTITGLNFRGNSPAAGHLRYAHWQNYFGNGGDIEHGNAKMHMDDIYMSRVASGTGAFVRAELVNNAVYASATAAPVICEVLSIEGTTWSVKLNGAGTGKWLALFNASNVPTMVAL